MEADAVSHGLRVNHTHQQFLEDVLLPRFCDELNIQRQLIVVSLQEYMVHLLQQAPRGPETMTAAQSSSFGKMSFDSLAEVSSADQLSTGWAVNPAADQLDHEALEPIVPRPSTEEEQACHTGAHSPKAYKAYKAYLPKVRTVPTMSMTSVMSHYFKDGTHQSWLYKHVHSNPFRLLMSMLIISNSMIIGFQTQDEFSSAIEGNESAHQFAWTLLEVLFAALFSLELAVRCCADGRLFFYGSIGLWNLFDALLVGQAIFSLLSDYILANATPNFSFVRLLRILRFFRVLRVLRVMKHFRSFRVMMVSMMSSLPSLISVLLMLAFVLYLFSVMILHCIMTDLDHSDVRRGDLQQLLQVYGGLSQTILSLFMATTGGKDWADLYTPLANLHEPYGWIFICYIYLSVFGVLNVTTSLFVDSVNQASSSDYHNVVHCELERRNTYVKACRHFFVEADKNGSKKLSREELNEYLQDEENKAYLATLGLDESEAHGLYTLLDVNGKNDLDIEEFVQGCERLSGSAKAINVNMFIHEHEKFIDQFKDFRDHVYRKLETIGTRALSTIPDERTPKSPLGHLSL